MLSAKWRPFCLGLNVLIWPKQHDQTTFRINHIFAFGDWLGAQQVANTVSCCFGGQLELNIRRDYYPDAGYLIPSRCNSFEDRVPDIQMSYSDLNKNWVPVSCFQ